MPKQKGDIRVRSSFPDDTSSRTGKEPDLFPAPIFDKDYRYEWDRAKEHTDCAPPECSYFRDVGVRDAPVRPEPFHFDAFIAAIHCTEP